MLRIAPRDGGVARRRAELLSGQTGPGFGNDALLCFLDVGNTPTHIALKPDGGEVFTTNFDSDSISEISTWTNEVLGTYIIGAKPVRAAFTLGRNEPVGDELRRGFGERV